MRVTRIHAALHNEFGVDLVTDHEPRFMVPVASMWADLPEDEQHFVVGQRSSLSADELKAIRKYLDPNFPFAAIYGTALANDGVWPNIKYIDTDSIPPRLSLRGHNQHAVILDDYGFLDVAQR